MKFNLTGQTPCSIEVPVNVKVIDRSMPVFDKQFYTDSVLESIEVHSPLSLSIQAESPLGRKLIYSITKGNDFEEFALDFNTGECSLNFSSHVRHDMLNLKFLTKINETLNRIKGAKLCNVLESHDFFANFFLTNYIRDIPEICTIFY